MRVKVWGARGSIPCPGPETVRYGGNTSCVQTTLSDGTQLVLDAGTGIRNLTLPDEPGHIHILLTHLHLDHIQGLLFFAPLFDPRNESRSGARRLPAVRCATASRATCRRR